MPSGNARKRKAQKKAAANRNHPDKSQAKPATNHIAEQFPDAANNIDIELNGTETIEHKLEVIELTDSVPVLNTSSTELVPDSEPKDKLVPVSDPKDELVPNSDEELTESDEGNEVKSKLSLEAQRGVTGVLNSHPESRDLHVTQVTISSHGSELLSDAKLELNYGRKYGLVGLNGCGKTTLLEAIAAREIPVPKHFDIYLHQQEAESSDKTALQLVIEVGEEISRIEDEIAELSCTDEEWGMERITELYDRMEELDAVCAESKAAEVLHGLGFTSKMMERPSKDFSGGWRMRIALAKALFVKPLILLLDEPTNHLDLCACVWLEQELKKYKRILVLVSHSQDFMNGVCTNIIHLQKRSLFYYGGNYDVYVRTRSELEEHQMKRHNWEQGQIKHMKDYVARFGHGSAKLARQAQSKEKVLAKMVAGGLTDKVVSDKVGCYSFRY
ncbi:hypothetical protein LOD99_15396 [Oopsacas minuta]|uniref:ABC transporter domain-containing protein n=1 Tax=Oopsacas minuta TaxID=111878 RepID=A0AAV7KAW9_9METZ|nr:hypothetical protein LOD99_15396 [Oopsacas minuta]